MSCVLLPVRGRSIGPARDRRLRRARAARRIEEGGIRSSGERPLAAYLPRHGIELDERAVIARDIEEDPPGDRCRARVRRPRAVPSAAPDRVAAAARPRSLTARGSPGTPAFPPASVTHHRGRPGARSTIVDVRRGPKSGARGRGYRLRCRQPPRGAGATRSPLRSVADRY